VLVSSPSRLMNALSKFPRHCSSTSIIVSRSYLSPRPSCMTDIFQGDAKLTTALLDDAELVCVASSSLGIHGKPVWGPSEWRTLE
jgi:hypothetical protein